jgi:hypothetical protein
MDVTDVPVKRANYLVVRLGFNSAVVRVEHGRNRWMRDVANHSNGFGHGVDYIRELG